MAKIEAKQVKELRDRTGVGMMDAKKALVETDGDMDKAVDLLREKGMASADKKADRIAAEGLTDIYVDGNLASLIEVNSETDFVAKNEKFQTLVADLNKAALENNPADLDAFLASDFNGQSVDEAVREATSTIGEKISLRRFEVVEKTDDQNFGPYSHMGGKISVLVLINGGSEEVARDVAMHVAAVNPLYATRDDVSQEAYDHEKSVQIEKAKNEGKPENIIEKMVEGRMNKWLSEISLVDQDFVKDPDITVGKYLENNGASLVNFIRYEVGEGLEKRQENFAEEVAKELGQN